MTSVKLQFDQPWATNNMSDLSTKAKNAAQNPYYKMMLLRQQNYLLLRNLGSKIIGHQKL